jgi:hypothetical protein
VKNKFFIIELARHWLLLYALVLLFSLACIDIHYANGVTSHSFNWLRILELSFGLQLMAFSSLIASITGMSSQSTVMQL